MNTDPQVEMITSQSMKAGFTGGLVVDFPNSTKAKKFFLVLMTGGSQPLPQVLCGVYESITGCSTSSGNVFYCEVRLVRTYEVRDCGFFEVVI